jgi:putative membrane protein
MDWLPYVSGFWIFPVFCLLFMAIMMIGCHAMPFRFGHGARHADRGETGELLDRRYARGEIGKDQYEAMRRDLNG